MRRKAKIDNSHAPIVRALKDIGILYTDVSGLPAFCDLLVYFRGVTYHIEAKSREYASRGQQVDRTDLLTEGERGHMEKCDRTGVPYYIVFDSDELLKAIGAT